MGCFSGIIPSLRRGRDAHGSSRNADEDVSTPVQTVSDFLVPRVPTVASSKQTLKPPPSECYCQFSGTSEPAEDWHTEFPLPAYSLNDVWDVEGAKAIEGCIDSLDTELRDLSIKIHDHPELGYEEKYAHKILTDFMRKHGFEVTPHYLGIDTAWRATWTQGEGGRIIGFNSEMDALPGIGHACGHNLIAIGGVAAALGVRAAIETSGIPGTVILLGTPAEEGGNGKIRLIEKGAYRPMHACLMMHPSPGPKHTVGTGSSLAIQRMTAEYVGKTAHASASPWDGQNALDAAVLAYSSISALRQQIKPTHRVHGIIEGRDWAPNIIPDYACLRYLVRAPTADEAVILSERVEKCFQAAALATGCTVNIDIGDDTLYDLRQNRPLAGEFNSYMGRYGYVDVNAEGAVGGSTDFGNVTYELPALHPSFAIPTVPNGGNHTRAFAEAARAPRAHSIALNVAKGIAVAGLRIVASDEFYAKVKKAHDDEFGKREPKRKSQGVENCSG